MQFRNSALAAAVAMTVTAVSQGTFADMSMVDGQVTKIDQSSAKMTLRHGPIKNLDMDSMTMVFRVKDTAMLRAIKVGDKVQFQADRVNGALTIVQIRKK